MRYLKIFLLVLFFGVTLLFSNSGQVYSQTNNVVVTPAASSQSNQSITGEFMEGNTTYTLGKGDVVNITVREQEEFSGQFVIGPDGNIQYTFVGDVKAEGLDKNQLKEEITRKLEKFIKIPEVSVIIAAYRSKFIYMLGEVGRPGKYPMSGDAIKLRDAIVASGLPTRDAALRRVWVIKPGYTKKVVAKKVDIYKLLYKGDLNQDVMLEPGDLVVVSSTVPSEINRALTNLLSPITRAAVVQELLDTY
ncbi:MAG: polysaccharide export protein [Candidatus Omnitrophica bacterium]|nr:polysaccharide export protein [Candidatus Omnitrophota bacterium]MCK5393007.1 polysaccharide export protein [Candidatus Omnitrophota bacterium]MCK5492454.1 polysaccharide export protein [Candidatus Omnitrophota bacterium]